MSDVHEALKPGLMPFEDNPHLWQYPDMPEWIVRPVSTTPGEAFETARQSRELLHELQETYGIDVVPFSVSVIDAQTVCFVSEKIEGRGLGIVDGQHIDRVKKADLTDQQFRVANGLLGKHYDYLLQKVITKGPFPTDIFGLQQYMLTPDDRAVLVDVESSICNYQNKPDNPVRLFAEEAMFFHLAKSVVELLGEEVTHREWQMRFENLLATIFITNGLILTSMDKVKELTSKVLLEGLQGAEEDAVDEEIMIYLSEAFEQRPR